VNRISKLLSAAVVSAIALAAAQSRGAVVINEVYSGGGSAQATAAYHTDYIELYNNSGVAADISGYIISYGSSAQAAGSFPTAVATIPAGTSIAASGYFLIRTGSAGTGGAADPNADLVAAGGASLSNTSGGLRLQDNSATPVTLDVVGWGTTNNFEGAAESSPASVAVSMQRIPNGLDTDNNQADFLQGTPTPSAANVVPEPASPSLLGLGGAALLVRRRRK
jgi:hypothetical protein